MQNDIVVKNLKNDNIKHIIINSQTFRNVKHTDELEYLQKLLTSFKQSYVGEGVVVYESLPCLENIESYIKTFTESNGLKMIKV
jgi:hypothetical protein